MAFADSPYVSHGGFKDSPYETASAGANNPRVVARASVPEPDPDPDKGLLAEAHERFRACQNWESPWRHRAEEEINFVDHLQHWDERMKRDREGLPCLTFDRISPAIAQVVNDSRQSPPEPKYSPIGGGADRFTAIALEGLWRNVYNDSDGDIAIETAYEWAVKIGRGWWGFLTEYESDDSFRQKITIRRFPNWASVYPDPSADKFDMSDMRYCFVTDDVDKDLFKYLYPWAKNIGTRDFSGIADNVKQEWYPKGSVRIAEYWWIEEEEDTIHQLENGVVYKDEDLPPGAEPVSSRKVQRRKVYMAKITGMEVLEQYEWPGQWIPLIPVIGKESVKDGKRTLSGMIRPAMDANLSYDFQRSKETQVIGLAPISPVLIADGSIEGFETMWADSNRKAYAYLPYKSQVEGQIVPSPHRAPFTPDIGAITGAIAHAEADLDATLSSYPSDRGAPSNETSGRAILARQRQGDNAHFHFHDNLSRSVRHGARIFADLVPHVITEATTMHIMNPDASSREITVNAQFVQNGVQVIYALNNEAARYHVTMDSGPSESSRRAEGRADLIELARTNPIIMQRAPDIFFKALDVPYGDELAARFAPPGTPADGMNPNVAFQQLQATAQQQNAVIQQLTQALHAATDAQAREKMKLDSQERQNDVSAQAGITEAFIKTKSAESIAQLEQELAFLHKRFDQLAATQQSTQDHQEATAQADQQHQQVLAQQAAAPKPAAT